MCPQLLHTYIYDAPTVAGSTSNRDTSSFIIVKSSQSSNVIGCLQCIVCVCVMCVCLLTMYVYLFVCFCAVHVYDIIALLE